MDADSLGVAMAVVTAVVSLIFSAISMRQAGTALRKADEATHLERESHSAGNLEKLLTGMDAMERQLHEPINTLMSLDLSERAPDCWREVASLCEQISSTLTLFTFHNNRFLKAFGFDGEKHLWEIDACWSVFIRSLKAEESSDGEIVASRDAFVSKARGYVWGIRTELRLSIDELRARISGNASPRG